MGRFTLAMLLVIALANPSLSCSKSQNPGEGQSENPDETRDGLNPTTAIIKDPDECPQGWTQIGSRCFIYDATLRDYDGSSKYCKSIGGMIASVHSEKENRVMLGLFPVDKAFTVYIGAEYENGQWKWHDGSPWWQPSKHGGLSGLETRIGVNCPHCDNDGLWHDWGYGQFHFGVICTLNLGNE